MEPVTFAAIAGAIGAGVASGTGEVAIKEAYSGLKSLLWDRYGADSELAKAVDGAEKHPDSAGYTIVLGEEVESADPDADAEIREAAQILLDRVRAEPSGEKHIQKVKGNFNAVANTGGFASVNVSSPEE